MARTWLRPILSAAGLLVFVSFITFGAMNVLGDPVFNILGPVANDVDNPESRALVAAVEAEYHLDEALPVRWARWAGDFVRGDFGVQFSEDGRPPVADLIAERLPRTLLLIVLAQALALVISVPWALWSAPAAETRAGRLSTVTVFLFVAVPDFALAVILKYVFSVRLQIFPQALVPSDPLVVQAYQLLLPAFALALPSAAVYQRLLRADLLATLREDFVAAARSKGLPKWRILRTHVLRPSLSSFLTVFGISTGALLGGTLVIENVFLVPGLGRAVTEAILREDFPVVLAVVMLTAVTFIAVNLVVNLAYSAIDPRVRR